MAKSPTHLNVGCGPHRAPEPWWNIDRIVRPGNTEPDEVVGDTLPYEDNSLDRLYAGHILEHVPVREMGPFLAEWMRVLKPGGQIGIVGPDVNVALDMFKAGELTKQQCWERMEHSSTDSLEAWSRMYGADKTDDYARHHWNCTPERAIAYLQMAGFEDVRSVPIESTELDEWPLVSRCKDQISVLGRKPIT